MFIVPANRKDVVLNLNNAKKIFNKLEKGVESEKDYLKLYADENLIVSFSVDGLDKFIKKNILNAKLTKLFLELENISSFVSEKNIKRFRAYGYKKIDSFIDEIIEREETSKKLFEFYLEELAFRFMVVRKRCASEEVSIFSSNVLVALIFGDLFKLALDELDEKKD